MARTPNSEQPVYIVVDKTTVGYLSTITKTDPKIIMCNLRDLGNVAIERLQNRTHGYHTWTKAVYPDTELKVKVDVRVQYNNLLACKHADEHRKRYEQATGDTLNKRGRNAKREAYHRYHEWCKLNPEPWSQQKFNYQSMMVQFTIADSGYKNLLMMSEDEINTVLVEEILLAPVKEDEEDE
jgi:hypothetical protein